MLLFSFTPSLNSTVNTVDNKRNNKVSRTIAFEIHFIKLLFAVPCKVIKANEQNERERKREIWRRWKKIKTNHWIISPFQSIFLFIYMKSVGAFRAPGWIIIQRCKNEKRKNTHSLKLYLLLCCVISVSSIEYLSVHNANIGATNWDELMSQSK